MTKYKVLYEANVIFEKEIEVSSEQEAYKIARDMMPSDNNHIGIKSINSSYIFDIEEVES